MTETARATIGDVAAHAGVSIATVSRAVNGRYGVSPRTVARVQAAIDDLGYESSLVARSLRSRRTNVIGILVSGIEPFSAEVLKGVSRALQHTGFELVVYSGGMSGRGPPRHPSPARSRSPPDWSPVRPPGLAVGPAPGGGLSGGPGEAGVEVDESIVLRAGFTREKAEEPAHRLLSRPDRPTAIFAANDLAAIQVVETAEALGLSVPDDLSVVGFDNIPDSALVDPPLTTVDQSIQRLGEAAVEILIDLIDRVIEPGSAEPVHVTVPTSLVVRRSTAGVGR